MFSSERIPCVIHLTPEEFVRQNTRTGNGIRNSFGFMHPIFRRNFLMKQNSPINQTLTSEKISPFMWSALLAVRDGG